MNLAKLPGIKKGIKNTEIDKINYTEDINLLIK